LLCPSLFSFIEEDFFSILLGTHPCIAQRLPGNRHPAKGLPADYQSYENIHA
jgi:hypothetical protein